MLYNVSRYTDQEIDEILTREIGPEFGEYRHRWAEIDADTGLRFPLHLDFELNDYCNQSCLMCPRNEETHPDINYKINTKSVLDFDLYRRIIDEGAEKGLSSINLGAFAEPLIHKRCFDMVAYAHEKGIIDSRIITNGLLLHRHIDKVFDSGLVNLFVSLDAFREETYASLRGPGFARVKESLLAVLEERKRRGSVLPIVRVSLVNMEINRDDIDDFIAYWRPKVDFIDIQIFDDFNVDIEKPHDLDKPKKWDCLSPWGRLAVLSDGRVLPCCNFFGWNVPVGNAKLNSIEEIWRGQALDNVRSGILCDGLKNCSICQRVGS